MAYYFTVGVEGTAATNTYTALNTGIDNATVTAVRIPSGTSAITMVGGAYSVSTTWTIDTGNVVFVKLSGAGLVDGDQELVIGGGVADETGTSVTSDTAYLPATYQRCNIRVKPGNDVYCSASYNGTDSGTQVIAVTLEVS